MGLPTARIGITIGTTDIARTATAADFLIYLPERKYARLSNVGKCLGTDFLHRRGGPSRPGRRRIVNLSSQEPVSKEMAGKVRAHRQNRSTITWSPPAQPAGAGVVGLAGGASVPADPSTSSTGVFGVGSPAVLEFDPDRGGVFGSAGNIAQVQLIPAPGSAPPLPTGGRQGDLYVTVIDNAASIFLCVIAGDSHAAHDN